MALISQPLTGKPLAGNPELDELREDLTMNVPAWERVGSVALGVGLLAFGVSRRSLWGGLAGLAGLGSAGLAGESLPSDPFEAAGFVSAGFVSAGLVSEAFSAGLSSAFFSAAGRGLGLSERERR